jgi:beta-barrel assembly-enhancing protease
MTAAFSSSKAAWVAALAFGIATALGAQSTPQSTPATDPVAAPAKTTPQANPPATNAPPATPSAQPAPGTAPVAGDTPAQPAPNSKDTAAKTSTDTPPDCTPADTGKKDKKNKNKDKDSSNPCPAAGTQPVEGDVAAANVDPQKVVEVGSEKVSVKPGSIEDVSAVGNRNIGGRGMGNWYSTDTEIKMGKGYSMEIEKSTRFITDPVISEYVNRVGQNIVKNSDCKVPFTIKVIDSDEINAMALPGGFFYVNSGLILNADEEAELAGVMAHETAHVCAHHAVREQTRMNYAQLSTIPLMFVGGWTGYGIYEAMQFAVPITFLKFSRDFESQADYLGIQYMYRAGYDPQAFISFFEKIQAQEKKKPGTLAKAFSTHPQTPDRIEKSQQEIEHILAARAQYVVSTSEFDDVKSRLAAIENRHKILDKKEDQNKPSLRRTSSTDQNGKDDKGNDDDRPTLKRRDDSN